MYEVRLKDSGMVVAVRKSLSGAAVAAKKRALTCPARFEIVEVKKGRKE